MGIYSSRVNFCIYDYVRVHGQVNKVCWVIFRKREEMGRKCTSLQIINYEEQLVIVSD